MSTLLLSLVILTPLAAVQTFCAAGLISMIMEIAEYGTSGAGDIVGIVMLALVLVGVNKLVCLIRFGKRHGKAFYVLDFIFAVLRLPCQLITDVLAFLALFLDIDVCPRNEPDFEIDGLFDYITIYFLQYEKGGKIDRKAIAAAARRPAPAPTPTYTPSAPSGATVFRNALGAVIDNKIIYNNSRSYLPSATYGTCEWKGNLTRTITPGKVVMRGTINYRYTVPSNMTADQAVQKIKADGERCANQAIKNLQNGVDRLIDEVRTQHRDYDGTWEISVEIKWEYNQR